MKKGEVQKILDSFRDKVIKEAKQGLPRDTGTLANSLKSYVKDLAEILSKGSIVEQKSFISSFIERIVVNHPEAEIFYNLPIINEKGRTAKFEVLPLL